MCVNKAIDGELPWTGAAGQFSRAATPRRHAHKLSHPSYAHITPCLVLCSTETSITVSPVTTSDTRYFCSHRELKRWLSGAIMTSSCGQHSSRPAVSIACPWSSLTSVTVAWSKDRFPHPPSLTPCSERRTRFPSPGHPDAEGGGPTTARGCLLPHKSTPRERGPGCHREQEMGRQDCAWRRCWMSFAQFGPKTHFIEVRSKKSR